MTLYRERLVPGPWLFVATALVIPATLLVFVPINLTVGVITAIVLYAGCVVFLLVASPTISVSDAALHAGAATLPIAAIGEVSVHREADATAQRGPDLDGRAWLLIRGWISPVVRVEVADDRDPVPYWVLSSRRPEELAAAIASARGRTESARG